MKLIYIMALLAIGCTKDPMPTPCKNHDCSDTIKPKENKLELIWQKQLRIDGDYTVGYPQINIDDYIVFGYDAIEQEKLLFVNKRDTSSSRFYGPNFGNYVDRFYHPVVGLIAVDYKQIFAGHTTESMKCIAGAPPGLQFGANSNLIGDELYMDARDEGRRINYILKVNVLDGGISYDRIVKDNEYPEYDEISIQVPSLCIGRNNDSILIYNYWRWKGIHADKPFNDAKIINQDKLLWQKEAYKISTVQANTISYNGKTVGVTPDSIYYVDPLTYETIWSLAPIHKSEPNLWSIKNIILLDSKLYFLGNGHFVVLDANSGAVLYDSPKELSFPTSNSKLTYFDGVFYWTGLEGSKSWIFGLRASDKKVVLKMLSPNQGKPPYYNDTNYDKRGLSIDPETRLAYTHDGFFAQCFRIPEKWE